MTSSKYNSLSLWEKQIRTLRRKESYISITIGFSFVILVAVFTYKFFAPYNSKISKSKQPQNNKLLTQKGVLGVETYTVGEEDDLWKIAVKFYGDGFAWTKIAKANNLDKPDTIHPGNNLIIPK